MKVLVMGATGMAGHTIALYFIEQGHDVTAFSRKPFKFCNNIVGDITDTKKILQLIDSGNYDSVINCIGILNHNAEQNPSEAVYLNSYLPHMLADFLKDKGTKLIQMSTDCVFSGKTGGYRENDLRDGETLYDRTKALGEVIDDRNLTFRTSIIGPDMHENGIGLFNWFMKQKGTLYGYTNAIWTGVNTLTLAKAMEYAIQENLCGLYNLVNNHKISKYDLLILFNKYFKNDEIAIKKNDNIVVDKSLINTRNDFSFKVPDYEKMIIEMKDWICSHPYLYLHYKMSEI